MFYLSAELKAKLNQHLASIRELQVTDESFKPTLNKMDNVFSGIDQNSRPFSSELLVSPSSSIKSLVEEILASSPNLFKSRENINELYHQIPIFNRGWSRSDFVELKSLYQASKKLLDEVRDEMTQISMLINFHLTHLNYLNSFKSQLGQGLSIFPMPSADNSLILLGCINFVCTLNKINPEILKVVLNDFSSIITKLKEQNPCPDQSFLEQLEKYKQAILDDNPELNDAVRHDRRL